MKKGDDVADDEDDDAVKISVSEYRVKVTMCIEELFLSTLYIYSGRK
jgi:hypothetical protein